jgi:ech hydrogenase subunit D
MLENARDVEPSQIQNEIAALMRDGWRLVTVTCLDLAEAHEVLYHFDRQYVLTTLRVRVPVGTVLPSISNVCFAAVLAENEIKDMFGVTFEGLAIDYKGRFLLGEGAPVTPLNKKCGLKVDLVTRPPASPAPAAGGAPS